MSLSLFINGSCFNYKFMFLCNDNCIKRGSTPLHKAAANNSKECLALLLSRGAEVNIKDKVSNIMICCIDN